MGKKNPNEAQMERLRYRVTGIQKSKALSRAFVDGRERRMAELVRHFPDLEKVMPSNGKRYSRCRGGANCRLRMICEGCWHKTIVMPAVEQLFTSDYKPKRPIEEDNLYVVTFTGLASHSLQTLDGAVRLVRFSQDWFRRLVNMPVFRDGGVIFGGMAYWYPVRFPRHSKFEEHVHKMRFPIETTAIQNRGWAPKVVMLLRLAFRVSASYLREYLAHALGWEREFTPEQLKNDLHNARIKHSQDAGNYTPEGEPGNFQCQVRVRRVTSLEDGIIRYGTGRLSPLTGVTQRNSWSQRIKTQTSFGTRVFRNLRLPLLDCDPDEAARLLAVLSQLTVRCSKRQVVPFGDFRKDARPPSDWLRLTGCLRASGVTKCILYMLKLDRPPVTDEELQEFRRRINKLTRRRARLLIKAFLQYGTCSEAPLRYRTKAEMDAATRNPHP